MTTKLIVDGENAVLGRMASFVSKELLKGKSVDVINSEKIIISGKKKLFVEKIKEKRRMGRGSSLKGPKYIRQEDRIVKRMIRGMLPFDRARGREAIKRLRCHIGTGNFKEEELKNAVSFKIKKFSKSFTIKEVIGDLK